MLYLRFTLFFLFAITGAARGAVVSDPGNPAATASSTKSVTASGVTIPVVTEVMNYSPSTRSYDVAKFTLSSAATVVVTSTEPITTYSITPAALGISGTVSGNTLTFSLSEPQNLVIHINSQTDLLMLATTPETETYTASGGNVTYYGPGIHTVGVVTAVSNSIYYLAPGALVYGVFNMFNVQNVKIIGRGIIDGGTYSKTENTQPVIYSNNASNVRVQGVGVRHANGWQTLYYNSDHINISYVNVLGGVVINHDGIDLDGVEDVTVRNSLIYSGDDGFGWHAVGSGNDAIGTVPNFPMKRVLAENNVVYNDVAGNGMRFGSSFETDLVQDITVRNHYVLHWDSANWAFESDVSDFANIRNLRLENWYLSSGESDDIYMVLGPTTYTNPVSGYVPGTASGIYFRNWNATGTAFKITLGGYDSLHTINYVSFESVTLGGTAISSSSQISNDTNVTDMNFYATEQPDLLPTAGVIDNNSSTGFTKTGGWTTSSLTGFNGGSTIYSNDTGATATWTPILSAAGYYTVYVWYPYATNSGTSAQYTVTYSGVTQNKTIDQTGVAGEWQSLGVFPFASGSGGKVTLTVEGVDTRANAIKFEPAIIVDNTDSGFSTTGTWNASTLTGFNTTSTVYANTPSTATWTPSIPTAGRYSVYVWYPSYSNNDTSAVYTITGSDGDTNVTVDQTTYAGKWRSLGMFDFAAGTTGTVKLTTGNNSTRADAVYFVQIPPQ